MHDPEIEYIVRSRHTLQSKQYELNIVQDPEDCRVMPTKEKSRGAKWPLEPPPVIELILHDGDPNRTYLHSPFWFCTVTHECIHTQVSANQPKGLVGSTVSSLHRVKLSDSKERGYFIFGDLNIKNTGTHRLKFSLFEMRQGQDGSQHMVAELLASAESRQFRILPAKSHCQTRESTPLSKQLCEAGVKLRIRKEVSSKRRATQFEWAADRSQVLPTGPIPSSRQSMVPSSRIIPSQQGLGSNDTGVDVRHRLSLSNQGGDALGIKSMMDGAPNNRPSGTVSSHGIWQGQQHAPQQPQLTRQLHMTPFNAQNWATPNWSSAATHASHAYSMPPSTSSYELTSGRPAYSTAGYRTSQPPMSSAYISQSQPPQNQLRGNDSFLSQTSSPFQHIYGTSTADSGINGTADHDLGGIPQFDLSAFSNRVATGGIDTPYAFQGLGRAQRSFPVTSGGDANDHFM